jgi:hypothetical protein
MMNISCVHHGVLKDPTLSAEERRDLPLPHLVVLPNRSVEDPKPAPGTPSLDLRLARVNKDPNKL